MKENIQKTWSFSKLKWSLKKKYSYGLREDLREILRESWDEKIDVEVEKQWISKKDVLINIVRLETQLEKILEKWISS